MSHDLGRRPAPAEVRSWDRSLVVLAQDLINAGLGQVEMLVEQRLPLTSQRVDAVLAGWHPQTGDPSYVVVELKQWTSAELWEDDPSLVLVDGYGRDAKVHPGAQVSRYCEYILDFTRALEDLSDPIAGVAYLHNATDAGVDDLAIRPQDPYSRLFTGQRRGAFVDYLRSRLDPAKQGAAAGDLLLNSAIARVGSCWPWPPTRCSGGRASGSWATSSWRTRWFCTPSRPRTARIARPRSSSAAGRAAGRASWRSPRTQALCKYFNQFMDAEPNSIDVLVLDEAHRIRETSADRWTRAQFRTGRPRSRNFWRPPALRCSFWTSTRSCAPADTPNRNYNFNQAAARSAFCPDAPAGWDDPSGVREGGACCAG